jgi:hypothetical protein
MSERAVKKLVYAQTVAWGCKGGEKRFARLRQRLRGLDPAAQLDPRHKALERPELYKVRYTAALNAMQVSEKLKVAERRR